MNKKIASEIAIGTILLVAILIGAIFWLNNKNAVPVAVENVPAVNVEKIMSKEELMEKKCLDDGGKIQNYEHEGKIYAECYLKDIPKLCLLEDYYNGSCGVGPVISNLTPGDCDPYLTLLKKYGSVKKEIIQANKDMKDHFIEGSLCQVSVKIENGRGNWLDIEKISKKLKEGGWERFGGGEGISEEFYYLVKDDNFLEFAGYMQPAKGAKIMENCNEPMCYDSYDQYILISSGVGYVESYN